MARFVQAKADRGSQRWLQIAVNENPDCLDDLLLPRLGGAKNIRWKSPLVEQEFAEYRDLDFLKAIEADAAASALESFWPARGPQWDALAISDRGDRLLVEAKAHIGELCSPATQARGASLSKIEAALSETARSLGATQQTSWSKFFYQITNRLAHLYFLRQQGINAWLVLVNFVGDTDMRGPASAAEWEAAYQIVRHVLGLSKSHKLSSYVIEIYPDVEKVNSSPLSIVASGRIQPASAMAPRTTT